MFRDIFTEKNKTSKKVQKFIYKMMDKYEDEEWSDKDDQKLLDLLKNEHNYDPKTDLYDEPLNFLNHLGYITTTVTF